MIIGSALVRTLFTDDLDEGLHDLGTLAGELVEGARGVRQAVR